MVKIVRLCLDRYIDGKNISRYALAKATKIGYPTIDRYYKNDVTRFDSDILSRIVTALGCRIEDILEITEEP